MRSSGPDHSHMISAAYSRNMKERFLQGCFGLLSVLTVSAATSPIFINDATVNSPPDPAPAIDATAWVNRAPFNISAVNGSAIPLPFESQNTLFFTNTPGGAMFGDPGFRWWNNVGPKRFWMDTWTNQAAITTDATLGFSAGFVVGGFLFVNNSQASVLMVHSTNLASTGPLRSGAEGLIYLEGKNLNLKRNSLKTGSSGAFFNGGFIFSSLLSSNYANDFGITDLSWGIGTNNTFNGRGPAMPLTSFNVPAPRTPNFEETSFLVGSPFSTSLPRPPFFFGGGCNSSNYTAAVWIDQDFSTGTNFVVQVVFYPVDNGDTTLTTEVLFEPDFINGTLATIPVVGFHSTDFDIADQAPTSESIYLTDALATVTNISLARNFNASTRRPITYQVSHSPEFGFPPNAVFDPSLFTGIRTNCNDFRIITNVVITNIAGTVTSVTNVTTNTFASANYLYRTVTNTYAAYEASVATVAAASAATGGDLTNFPGRIQIIGEEVSLDRTRIRAESALTIKASRNLTSNSVAQVDAPWINFDVTSLAPQLVISNIAPPTVRRLGGNIRAWSATWKNYDTNAVTCGTSVTLDTNASPPVLVTNLVTTLQTNEILFHVLIVDPCLTNLWPVTVNEFAAHAANVIIADTLRIGKSFLVEAEGLDIRGGVLMPQGASWGVTNLQGILNFTNSGTVSLFQIENIGADRDQPYDNYINHGTNTAATHFIRSRNFENSGTILASGGLLQIDALTATMAGSSLFFVTNVEDISFTNIFVDVNGMSITNVFTFSNTNVITNSFGSFLQGSSDVQIFADDMSVSNSFFQAGITFDGNLILSVTNRLVDAGPSATNLWFGSAGCQMLSHPATSDLLGTYLSVGNLGHFAQECFQNWCAEDRGPTVDGYVNNLALGKLTLNGAPNSLFHFAPPPDQANKAMYVDYLELNGFAANYVDALDFSPDFTLYFANANVNPAKLDQLPGGHLRWVKDFTGPLSSTNITYPSGQTYTFNTALVQSLDLDSDGDGILNGNDPTPIFEGDNVALQVTMVHTPAPKVQLSWRTLARTTNHVQYLSSPQATNWLSLTNIVNGPTNGNLRVFDSMPAAGNRFYRVRVDMPK